MDNKNKKGSRVWKIGLASTLVLAVGGAAFYQALFDGTRQWAEEHGFVFNNTIGIADANPTKTQMFAQIFRSTLHAPSNWWNSHKVSELPLLQINIDRTDLKKIEQRSQKNGKFDFIPATLSLNNEKKTSNAKLRLSKDKFIIDVSLDDKVPLFTMHHFTLRDLKGEDYMGPLLLGETIRFLQPETLLPRYFFVHLVVNRVDKGIIALEEQFEAELPNSQKRDSAGAILKLAPGLNPLNSYIETFYSENAKKGAAETRYYRAAVGLLRAYLTQQLPASEVFDIEKTATFLAAVDLWGASNALKWENLRFYYNPFIGRLEPIPYAMNLNDRLPPGVLVTQRTNDNSLSFFKNMLSDNKMQVAYKHAIEQYVKAIQDGRLQKKLKDTQDHYLSQIGSEFFLYHPQTFDFLSQGTQCLLNLSSACSTNVPPLNQEVDTQTIRQAINSKVVAAYLITKDGKPYIELQNLLPYPIEIVDIHGIDKHKREVKLDFASEFHFPVSYAATPLSSVAESHRISLADTLPNKIHSIEVLAKAVLKPEEISTLGMPRLVATIAQPYAAPSTKPVIPTMTAEQLVRNNPFIQWDENNKQLLIPSGKWDVNGSIVVPEDYHLRIQAGTTLNFSPTEAFLVNNGTGLEWLGEEKAPIVLQSKTENGIPLGWDGFALIGAKETTHWNYVTIRDTVGMLHDNWRLNAGTTFYHSPVHFDHCHFLLNHTEDQLNIVLSPFQLLNSTLEYSLSDGLDTDFSDGLIKGTLFQHNGVVDGGDALDLSGSNIVVEDSDMLYPRDKGASVGENTTVIIRNSRITGANVGIASKDSSIATLDNVSIKNCRYWGVMAYIKKPGYYGPASLIANSTTIAQVPTESVAQLGSKLVLNGKETIPTNLDVKELYKTIFHSDHPH